MLSRITKRHVQLKDLLITSISFTVFSVVALILLFYIAVYFSKEENEQFLFDFLFLFVSVCPLMLSIIAVIRKFLGKTSVHMLVLVGSFNIAVIGLMLVLGFTDASNIYILCFVFNIVSMILAMFVVATSIIVSNNSRK